MGLENGCLVWISFGLYGSRVGIAGCLKWSLSVHHIDVNNNGVLPGVVDIGVAGI